MTISDTKKSKKITFFVEDEVLNIFHLTIFSKKKKKISKIILRAMTIFEGKRHLAKKINLTFSVGNSFFFEKPRTG